MKAAPVFVVLVTAAASVAAQPKPEIVDVEVAVGEQQSHQTRCGQGNVPATTIFVVRDEKKQVRLYHCVEKQLHNHGDHETSQDHGAVRVFAGQRIRWFSTTRNFSVVSVTKPKTTKDYKPQDPLAPDPLFAKFEQKSPREVFSPVVPNIAGDKVVFQLYKTTFRIDDIGLVDPDVVCGM